MIYYLTIILALSATPGGIPAGDIYTYKEGPYNSREECIAAQQAVWQDKRVINATCKVETQ